MQKMAQSLFAHVQQQARRRVWAIFRAICTKTIYLFNQNEVPQVLGMTPKRQSTARELRSLRCDRRPFLPLQIFRRNICENH